MAFILFRTLRVISFALLGSLIADACEKTVYLTLDTGSMGPAEEIARVLRRHSVRVTFFLANEKTTRGDHSLDPSWAAYWKARVSEGHAFGSHTFRHWYFRRDLADGKVAYISREGKREDLDAAGVCRELKRSEEAFRAMTGRAYDPIWRAPGGRTTSLAIRYAAQCGFKEHTGWAPAGFLGDELPSETYPNRKLLADALARIRDGDILVMHLGIWSRKDPFWPMLDPLITGLKAKGFCFATIPERKGK
jgi:peptidoglycan/xylan/chitin deacetylase (PgdA/CDA1 family)